MRAVRFHAFGGPLVLEDVPEPEPGDGEVVVDVRFAGVNPLDLWVVEGSAAGGTQPLPFVPGVDGVGQVDGRTVVVRGSGVGVIRDGLYRERAAVPADSLVPVPDDLDPVQAAALGVTGPTAWRLVHDVLRVTPEDRVLVLGASGGVGSLVVQMAKAIGATVWAQTTNADKAAFVEGLGADRTVVTDAGGLGAAVADLSPTAVVDPLADGYTVAAIGATAPHGRIALFGASAGPSAEVDLRLLYRKAIDLLTYSGTTEPQAQIAEDLRRTMGSAARGEFRVPVDEVLPLEAAQDAHDRLRRRAVRGKLVLRP